MCKSIHMPKDSEKQIARELYLNTGMTQKEIAIKLSISEPTLSKWVNSGKWDELKAAKSITKEQLLKQAYEQLAAINNAIEERGGVPDKQLSDAKGILVKEIALLEKNHSISTAVYIMDRFLNYVLTHNPSVAREVSQMQLSFIEMLANEVQR